MHRPAATVIFATINCLFRNIRTEALGACLDELAPEHRIPLGSIPCMTWGELERCTREWLKLAYTVVSTLLDCTVLYCTVLYSTVLYCIQGPITVFSVVQYSTVTSTVPLPCLATSLGRHPPGRGAASGHTPAYPSLQYSGYARRD